jgi:hypothetical protein
MTMANKSQYPLLTLLIQGDGKMESLRASRSRLPHFTALPLSMTTPLFIVLAARTCVRAGVTKCGEIL